MDEHATPTSRAALLARAEVDRSPSDLGGDRALMGIQSCKRQPPIRSRIWAVLVGCLMIVASAGASLPAEFAQAVVEFSLCDGELLLGSLAELSQTGPLGDEYYWLNSTAAPPRLQEKEDPAGQPSTPLEVVRLPGPEALCDIAGDWERLDALSRPRTPFSSPLWNSLWWKHYRRSDLLRKDELLVLAVRSSDGQVVAVAPMFKRSWPAIGPARWRVIQFFGADASITELRGVVCAPENRAMALDALKAYFRDEYRDWNLISVGRRTTRAVATSGCPDPGRRTSLPAELLRHPACELV